MVRATRSGSSTIARCPTAGKSTHVAPGRRSRAVWPYVAAVETGRGDETERNAIGLLS